jgi:hypothetical protein
MRAHPFRVVSTPDRGRCVVAAPSEISTEIPAGTVIFTALPYGSVVCEEWAKDKEVCWFCFRFQYGKRFKSRCQSVVDDANAKQQCRRAYCSDACAEQDWLSGHRFVCAQQRLLDAEIAFRKTGKKRRGAAVVHKEPSNADCWERKLGVVDRYVCTDYERDLLRLILDALGRRRREELARQLDMRVDLCADVDLINERLQRSDSEPNWNDLMALQTNEATYVESELEYQQSLHEFDETPVTAEPNEDHIILYQLLRYAVQVPSELLGTNADQFRAVLYREMANSFGVWDTSNDATQQQVISESSELLGYAIYPRAAFFNHSCRPNVRRRLVGRMLEFYTVVDVAAGDELNISYGYVDEPILERRCRLLKQFYFECQCPRCLEESTDLDLPDH